MAPLGPVVLNPVPIDPVSAPVAPYSAPSLKVLPPPSTAPSEPPLFWLSMSTFWIVATPAPSPAPTPAPPPFGKLEGATMVRSRIVVGRENTLTTNVFNDEVVV